MHYFKYVTLKINLWNLGFLSKIWAEKIAGSVRDSNWSAKIFVKKCKIQAFENDLFIVLVKCMIRIWTLICVFWSTQRFAFYVFRELRDSNWSAKFFVKKCKIQAFENDLFIVLVKCMIRIWTLICVFWSTQRFAFYVFRELRDSNLSANFFVKKCKLQGFEHDLFIVKCIILSMLNWK